MKRPSLTLLFLFLLSSVLQAQKVEFSTQIQPILAKHCIVCHGPDKAESGLRLTSSESAYAALVSGAHAVVPGKPGQSELLARVTSAEDDRMPPEGDPLTAAEVSLLKQWITDGAEFDMHWAYRPVAHPKLPSANVVGTANPIDAFVIARLMERGLNLSDQAEPAILVKRLYYDLLGIPPTPEEVDSFLNDRSEGAYLTLVNKLLDSLHFGERWGRHWLDKARYADSDGYEKDRPRPNAWRYRDWVIHAINEDLPFDQFTIQQLAGDLLSDPTDLGLLATAFHRQTLTNTEGGTDKEQFRIEATFDRTETTSAVWMGLTMTCARCHTHKYDSISQREYYQLFGFFNDSNEGNTEVSASRAALAKYNRDLQEYETKTVDLREELEAAKKEFAPRINGVLQELERQVSAPDSVSFDVASPVRLKTSGKSKLEELPDQSLLATGEILDKDEYTLFFDSPKKPLTGIKVELLTDDRLASNGPGRAPNGNFVLSSVRLYRGRDAEFKDYEAIKLVRAEADFSQSKFEPDGILKKDGKSGWAIAPETGKPHQITIYTTEPVDLKEFPYIQIVLDQQYGGQHTIGRFRVSLMSGFNPARALPASLVKALQTPAQDRDAAQHDELARFAAHRIPATSNLIEQLAKLDSESPKKPTMTVRIMQPATRTTKVLHRGDFLTPKEEVSNSALAVVARTHPLAARQKDQRPDRLDLAQWLVDPRHPLTARVTVNHVWARLFGRGLVPTVNDFGVRGEAPTHPKLLDWLAWTFPREMGWSRKELIRTIVTSSTYRQSSRHRADLRKVDATNRLFGRQNRVRVEAEIIRDLNLSVSGLLSSKIGGPSVFPPLPPGVAELSYANNFKWKTSDGEDRYRRGMYTFFKRTSPHPTLISFDCPDSNTTSLQRTSSNTPLQALATLNNEVFTEAAQSMARRVLQQQGEDDDRLVYALRLCTVRSPSERQLVRFRDLLAACRKYYGQHPDDAKALTKRHMADGATVEENAAWVATVRMILNLDEFIVRD